MILTRNDLSDEENLRECRHHFTRAWDAGADRSAALSLWAAQWGDAALHALENPETDRDELAALEKDMSAMEERAGNFETAMRTAVDKLEDAAYDDAASKTTTAQLEPIIQALEQALNA